MTVVIGTAGHIDHGKSTLLRALTGIDPDRLPEERRRGMTIDVGYAHMPLPGGEVDFVDVPGHDRLIGNMLVGAGEIDAAMLVVAADDGPRAQTIEHLELLDAIGIRDGIVVLTKVDLVSSERRGAVAAEVRSLLGSTALRAVPVVEVSATSGEGLEDVREAIEALRRRLVPEPAGRLRLAIDRTFTVRGRGVVVTGTLRGGRVARGDTLRLVPAGRDVRVRELQVHGSAVEHAGLGRVAMNVAGVELAEVGRGMVLTSDAALLTTDRLLVRLARPAAIRGLPRVLPADRTEARLHLGTEDVGVVVGRSARDSVALDDGSVTALLRLARPVAAAPGDRFVLRRPSPSATLAGGVVLDAQPPRAAARRRSTAARLAAMVLRPGDAAARLDLHGAVASNGSVSLAADVAHDLAAATLDMVATETDAGVPMATLRARLARDLRRRVTLDVEAATAAASDAIDGLVIAGRLEREGATVRLPGRRVARPSAEVEAAMNRLVAALAVPAPPPLAEAARAASCPPAGIHAVEQQGRIVVVADDLAWEAATWRRLTDMAIEMARRSPLTPAAYRDATGTSRKYVMALLEDFGRRGILRRAADGHVPGPRAPEVAGAPAVRAR